MKRILTLLIAFFALFSVYANERGHYWLDVENENIALEGVSARFAQWFAVSGECTFEAFDDRTDQIGMRHVAFQQYLNGSKVENCMVVVHARDGKVVSVNAAVMEQQQQPAARAKLTQAAAAEGTLIVSCRINGEPAYRPAYKTFDPKTQEDVYTDAETGAELKRISRVHKADVQGTAYTLYNGAKPFTVDKVGENRYQLVDNGRGIITVDASNADASYLYKFSKDLENGKYHNVDEEILIADGKKAFTDFLGTCRRLEHNSNTFGVPTITSVTITGLTSNDWWKSFGDSEPDLYIVIYDENNNEIYKSGYYDNLFPPLTFNDINIPLYGNYSIVVYDYDAANSDDFGGGITFSSSKIKPGTYPWSNEYTTGKFSIDYTGAAPMDAHWGMQKTYDFYKYIFNRKSYDGEGSAIINLMNPPKEDEGIFSSMPNNATAQLFDPSFIEELEWSPFMMYGYGDGEIINPVVALDVMAHEYTHLVTMYNGKGGLANYGESGALNESFSDIMGVAVKNYATGNKDYLIGEDVMIIASNMRSMKDPKISMDGVTPQPDTYHGQYWEDTTNGGKDNDNGGVHINNGVQNKWFYLLSEGGSGVNDLGNSYTVKGIGIQRAQQIAYRNLTNYLTPEATYADARNGSLRAAADLYGRGQEYNAVAAAWYAVGIGDKSTAVDETAADACGAVIFGRVGEIAVNGARRGERIEVYNAMGACVFGGTADSETVSVPAAAGFYIVRVGTTAKKVLVE